MEILGEGYCNGSFGELLQGILPGNKKFLINLKVKNRSHARIRLMPSEYSSEKENNFVESYRVYSKSYKILRNILVDIGRHDDYLLEIESDIPIGKGCSSSTADMIASTNALSSSLSLALKPEYLSQMLTEIEPNDGVHHSGTSIYHHTTGELITRYDYVPPLKILGIDFGGMIDSVKFNKRTLNISTSDMDEYSLLMSRAKQALMEEDIIALCGISTESTMLWQKNNPKKMLDVVIKFMRETNALGVVNTHSGTYLGVLYSEKTNIMEEIASLAKKNISGYKIQIFETISCA